MPAFKPGDTMPTFGGGRNLTHAGAAGGGVASGQPDLNDVLAGHDAALVALQGGALGPVETVRFKTTANVTLSSVGLTVTDGVTPVAGNHVLVASQSTASQNGIYIVGATAWTRLLSPSAESVLVEGLQVNVAEGTLAAGLAYVLGADLTTWTLMVATNAALSNATPAALNSTATAGVAATASRSDHVHDYGALSIANGDVAAATLTPIKDAVVDADGLGQMQVIRKAFTAAGPGVADDVTIYSANAPFGFRVVDVWVNIATAISGKTVTLRDAATGGGNALSDAISGTSTGVVRNTALTATRSIAANGSLIIRRSDNGLAGEMFIAIQKN